MTADDLAPCIARSAAGTILTHEQLEIHWCVIIILAADVLVLRHQVISNYSAESLHYYSAPVSYKSISFTTNNITKYDYV